MKKICIFLEKMVLVAGMLFTAEVEAQTDSLSKPLIITNDTIKPIVHEEVLIGIRVEQHPEFEGKQDILCQLNLNWIRNTTQYKKQKRQPHRRSCRF